MSMLPSITFGVMKSVPETAALPSGPLGRLETVVTRLGLGGEGVLRTFGRETEAHSVIGAALDEGITYYESARAYAGSESYYGRFLASRRDSVFLATKTHDRTKAGARAMLEQSLKTLKTSWLDLWQFHDIRELEEVERLEDPGGAYAALVEAKARGDVRAIGVTGHFAPEVLRAALERVPFDTVLLPINPAEGALPDGFERSVVPTARALGMGIIGMKVFAHGLLFGDAATGVTPEEAIAYALAADVDVIVVGCDDAAQVRQNARATRIAGLPTREARAELESRLGDAAEQLAYYRSGAPPANSSA
ncbi:MAG TPA: aldo/keto reductase [Gammaproteobacteria bacterium]|nr:aldo/keto reductase [Gammaproteobacteria bacterium]